MSEMPTTSNVKVGKFFRAPVLSPKGLILRGALLALIFTICEAAGLREHTTFISGTPTEAGGSVNASAILGVIYLAAYFGFVLVTPILMIAAGLLAVWEKWSSNHDRSVVPALEAHERKS